MKEFSYFSTGTKDNGFEKACKYLLDKQAVKEARKINIWKYIRKHLYYICKRLTWK